MNFLIIGGLLILAVLAIVGAILLSISEQRAERSRPAANATPLPATRPTVPLDPSAPNMSNPVSRPAPVSQAAPVTRERHLPARGESQSLSALNGQFHELATELRDLYQQAWELEQHLRDITEMADRIEDRQAGRFSIEEEEHARPSTDSTAM